MTLKRYIVWTTNNSGEFVRSESVREKDGKVQFIRNMQGLDTIIKEFPKIQVLDYHEAIWEFDRPYTTAPEYMKRLK